MTTRHQLRATLTRQGHGAPDYPHTPPTALERYVVHQGTEHEVVVLLPAELVARWEGPELVDLSLTAGHVSAGAATLEPVERRDGRWGWHLVHENGHVLATDGGQGYEDPDEAMTIGARVVLGVYLVTDPDGDVPDPA